METTHADMKKKVVYYDPKKVRERQVNYLKSNFSYITITETERTEIDWNDVY